MICSKYTQFLNFGPFVSDENPSIAKQNCTKKRPGRQEHIRIRSQCENPHPLKRDDVFNLKYCSFILLNMNYDIEVDLEICHFDLCPNYDSTLILIDLQIKIVNYLSEFDGDFWSE